MSYKQTHELTFTRDNSFSSILIYGGLLIFAFCLYYTCTIK